MTENNNISTLICLSDLNKTDFIECTQIVTHEENKLLLGKLENAKKLSNKFTIFSNAKEACFLTNKPYARVLYLDFETKYKPLGERLITTILFLFCAIFPSLAILSFIFLIVLIPNLFHQPNVFLFINTVLCSMILFGYIRFNKQAREFISNFKLKNIHPTEHLIHLVILDTNGSIKDERFIRVSHDKYLNVMKILNYRLS